MTALWKKGNFNCGDVVKHMLNSSLMMKGGEHSESGKLTPGCCEEVVVVYLVE